MTSQRGHRRAPLRRTSGPERVLTAGLATATCVGLVGLIGVRTIEANPVADVAPQTSTEATDGAAIVPVSATAPVTSSAGLTEAQLDAYAAQLATERQRLDEYRVKLTRTAKALKRQIARQNATATWSAPASGSSSGSSSSGSSLVRLVVELRQRLVRRQQARQAEGLRVCSSSRARGTGRTRRAGRRTSEAGPQAGRGTRAAAGAVRVVGIGRVRRRLGPVHHEVQLSDPPAALVPAPHPRRASMAP